MDRLTTFGLCILFYLFGPMITFCCLLLLLYNEHLTLNYASLFCLSTLFTYTLNGFLGVLYSFISCLIMVSCGAMYWFDWSPSDLKKELDALNQTKEIKYDDILTNKNIIVLKEYVSNGTQKFYQITGLTDEKIEKIKNVYSDVSIKFDFFSDLVWKYMNNIYEILKDIKGFKELFYYLSFIPSFIRSVDSIKSLHKFSKNLNMSMNQESNPGLGLSLDTGSMDMSKISDELNNMSPGQKKSFDDMTKQLLENININDMMSMMQGFGNLMNSPTSNSSNAKNKNKKKN